MPRIRRQDDRKAAMQRAAELAAAEALGQSEIVGPKVAISVHVAGVGEQLPRIPVIGMEAGAIRGTIPHRCRSVTR